jgi:GAF domain-containing protein
MTRDSPASRDLADVLSRMSGVLISHETLATSLLLVTHLAQETIPGTAGAGVTLIDRGRRAAAAASDPLVERADELQYALDQGPCLTAWRQRTLVRIDDVRSERRWPEWTAAVAQIGVRAVLSAPVIAGGDALGAIKVYAAEPARYDAHGERVLRLFAEQAAVLLANVRSHEDARLLSEGLKEALRTRDVIGQAKGMLMVRDGMGEDDAFAVLVRLSQQTNTKLRDVARKLVESARG